MTATEDTADRPAELLEQRPATRSRWHPLVVLPELAWMLALIFGYSLARLFVVDAGTGYHNAQSLWSVERALRLPSEAAFQQWVLHSPTVIRLANEYYASAHFPVTAVFLFWVYVWRQDSWRWVRNALTVFTAAALLIETLLPMAPPRLVHEFGMVDTGVAMGQSVYPASTHNGLANQFAAMPSVHVGWALLVAVCVITMTRGWWRWLALLHPLATAFVVTATANHYWADGIVAALLLGGTFLLPFVRRKLPSRRHTVAAGTVVPVSG